MTFPREQIIEWAREAGFDEYEWRSVRTDVLIALATLIKQAARADERSRCCRIVTGLCISDNNAQEITDAIRKGK